jgi:hypothetical protein
MRRLVTGILLLATAAGLVAQTPAALSDSAYARLVATLSEPAGFFDTDNLISNEDAYLHPLGTLKRLGVSGGAYVGVGPDQNFSYIAATRPRVAFIVDIRRDNLLEHLLFKALFGLARNRVEYLCLLVGRTPPADTTGWGARDVAALVAYVDHAALDPRAEPRAQERAKRLAVPLSAADVATMARFHHAFVADGLDLQFNSFGRTPQPYYPDYRRLILESDRGGRRASYLASEADFQFVKSLEERNLVVPVVGDFAGPQALAGIARWLRGHGEHVSAFYASNVEQYLLRDGSFPKFAANVAQLPRDASAVMIRSYFQGGHPQNVAGYHVTQVAQLMDRFAALYGASVPPGYFALVTRDVLEP